MPETAQAKFKKLLRVARANMEPPMSLATLARQIHRPSYTVQYWQYTGNIPSDALGDLCDALEVDMEYWRV